METRVNEDFDALVQVPAALTPVLPAVVSPPSKDQSIFASPNIKQFVLEALDSDKAFNRNSFSPNDSQNARLLEADYTEQVKIEAAEIAEQKLVELGANLPEAEFSENFMKAAGHALNQAREWRGSFERFWRNLSSRDAISIYGTSKDHLVNDRLSEFFRVLSEKCVANGISVISGGADTGAVGALNKAFSIARENWSRAHGEAEPPAVIATIPLKFYGSITEPKFQEATPGFACPPLMTFLSRTPTLFSVGRQEVALFTPGGLGTFEELTRAMAESKMARKVPGLYLDKSPLLVILDEDVGGINSDDGDDKGYYSGLRKWWKRMVDANTAPVSDFKNVAFYAEEDLSRLATLLVDKYLRPHHERFSEPSAERPKLLSRAIESLHQKLEESVEFNRRRFDSDQPEALRVLDAHFKQHVIQQAEAFLEQRSEERRIRNTLSERIVNPDQVDRRLSRELPDLVDRAVDLACSWRGQLEFLVNRFKDQVVIPVLGCEREQSWDARIWGEENLKKLEQSARNLVYDCVEKGYSLLVAGEGREGIGKRLDQYHIEALTDYVKQYDKESESKIIFVQLKRDRFSSQDQVEVDGRIVLGPPLLPLMTRTPFLPLVGKQLGVIAFPGGLVEGEVLSGLFLAAQMSSTVRTAYSGKTPPNVLLINPTLQQGGGVLDGLTELLQRMEDSGTITAAERQHIKFCSLDEFENTGLALCRPSQL